MRLVDLAARAATAVLGLALAACGGGADGGYDDSSPTSAICQVVDGSSVTNTTVQPSTIAQPTEAFDADLASYATLSPGASASTTIAGNGISRMAGEIAGIAYTIPTAGQITVTITTYDSGAVADNGDPLTQTHTATGGSQICPGAYCSTRNGIAFMGINTTAAFDEIEAVISISNFSAPLELRELCVR